MLIRPQILQRLGWLYVAAVCFVSTCTFWEQNNWMSYGGTHDFLALLPLTVTGWGGIAAMLCVIFGPRRLTTWIAIVGLTVVIPMAISEIAWRREWLATYPSRVWIYASVVSALAAIALLKSREAPALAD
ncbi:MAG: hypothetical protein ACAI38_00750 [Myxococcota bacterium]